MSCTTSSQDNLKMEWCYYRREESGDVMVVSARVRAFIPSASRFQEFQRETGKVVTVGNSLAERKQYNMKGTACSLNLFMKQL